MEKLDLAKQYKSYYTAKTKPELIDIEKAQYLSLTGKGDPSARAFADRIQALYATAYTIKFIFKEQGKDFVVPKLEGLWWYDEERFAALSFDETPAVVPRSEWEYRLLIRMPDFVSRQEVASAIDAVVSKKNIRLAKAITLHEMTEGKAVQMLHIGPFEKEPDTLKQLLEFTQARQLQKNGLHHEIYLSDFRKTSSDKLKTILREPVK
ncbi:GyrI-like domain-containing protein [Chitinophaga sp. GCM10012297]|uniref:GyrI-like domain-containing protein n=1 Tax=Chitinophaga chungangae TaxID=2821488 RepID=A0ABS3YAS4_9BACT|nr:GyrI-like domain-containing protein [Chitinophaga chungangae]MBO9151782.1 GyrI-like domain-containing protein [Chitinophaga chungangae]